MVTLQLTFNMKINALWLTSRLEAKAIRAHGSHGVPDTKLGLGPGSGPVALGHFSRDAHPSLPEAP